jgi:hypothetical protein
MSPVNPATSSQVSWWSVHEFVAAHLLVEHWPLIGSPDWCELGDDDPAKLAAVFDASRHWALRLETSQLAQTAAAEAIAGAADWPVIAHEIRDRAEFYAARPWLRRAAP